MLRSSLSRFWNWGVVGLATGLVLLLTGGPLVPAAQAQTSASPLLVPGPADVAPVRAGTAAFGDFNDDQKLDLLVAGDRSGGDNEVAGTTLYLGDGDGGFTPANADLVDVRRSASAVADLDDDGLDDIVLTGINESGLVAKVYLSDGDGTFTQTASNLDGIAPASIATGDVNNDQTTDLLVTGDSESGFNTSPSTTLYLGNGDGTFSTASASNLPDVRQSSVAIGNVDGDANADVLITGNTSSSGVQLTTRLLLGNGNGSFTRDSIGVSGLRFSNTAITDLDGDGNPDLFANGSRLGDDEGRTVIRYGNGDGTFEEGPPDSGLSGVVNGDIAIADFDDDQDQDLLISGEPEGGLSVRTTLFLNDGDRTYTPANTRLVDVGFSAVAAGDLYDDGDPDLALFGDAVPGLADTLTGFLYVNNTNQTPPNRAPQFIQTLPSDTLVAGETLTDTIEARDPDGDPLASLTPTSALDVTTNRLDNGTAEVTLTPSRVQAGRTPSLNVAAEDTKGARTSASASVRVSPFFALQSTSGPSAPAGSAPTADVNNDGTADLFVAETGTLYLGREDGSLTATTPNIGNGDGGGTATFGDVNTDGNPDLIFSWDADADNESIGDRTTDYKTALFLGSGDGTFDEFENANLNDVSSFGDISVGDVNGDDDPDLLITGEVNEDGVTSASTTLYLGNGDGTFSVADASLPDLSGGAHAIGDVNGDKNGDLLLTGGSRTGNVTRLYLSDGDGTFEERTPSALPSVSADFAAITDVGGTDDADLVLVGNGAGLSSPTASVYLGDGTASFTAANAGLDGVTGGTAALGDVNGDGNPDLFVAGDADPSFQGERATATLYLGDGSGSFSVAGAGLPGVADPPAPATPLADFDGDGDDDLVLLATGTRYQNLNQERTPSTTASESVSGDGSVDFGDTGVDVNFTGVGGSGNVTVERFDSGPFDPDSIDESNVSQYRLTIKGAGGLSFSSAEVQLAVGAFSGIDDPTDITIYKRPTDGTRAFTELTTTVGDNDTQTTSDDTLYASTSSFSEFVLASDSNPLPVELARFDATVDDGAVRLSWKTASETGNARFDIQRRDGAADWSTVGRVEGAGTTTEARSYRFVDADLPYETDALTYRLRQVDTDGTTSFSETVTVERGVSSVQLLGTAPNPAREQATVRYALPEKQAVTVRLYDVLGRRVRTIVSGKQEGRQEQPLDVSDLSSGAYFLRLRAGGTVKTRRMTVIR